MNLLIPYIPLYGHKDPDFDEFTYGDCRQRAKTLLTLRKNDVVFFHTSMNGKKHITAYFIVDRALNVLDIIKDRTLLAKYLNPHISEYLCGKIDKNLLNVVLFGDPISSRQLKKPLPFDKTLSQKLSLNIRFPKGQTETQAIGSATRSWRRLTERDCDILFEEISKFENTPIASDAIMSTEEVTDILERDVENYLEKHSHLIDKDLTLVRRQQDTPVGRIDLLFETKNKDKILVELKLGKIGREAIAQLRRYIKWLENETKKEKTNVSGILVCSGVMPAFEDEFRKLKNIRIFFFGWKMTVQPWSSS